MTTCADKALPDLKEEAIAEILAVSGAMRAVQKLLEVRTENVLMMEETNSYDMADLFDVLSKTLDGALEKWAHCERDTLKGSANKLPNPAQEGSKPE